MSAGAKNVELECEGVARTPRERPVMMICKLGGKRCRKQEERRAVTQGRQGRAPIKETRHERPGTAADGENETNEQEGR